MINLRNSVKAIVIQDGKLLFTSQRARDSGEVFYILPGGGQNGGETFAETLKRECLEELGAAVNVGDIALVREYIGKNHEFAHKHSQTHQIEYMFYCTLASGIAPDKATHPDPEQVGHEWIALAELKNKNVYPKVLKEAFDENGKATPAIYLGDVN